MFMKRPRKIHNLLVTPKFQMKYMFYFWVSGTSVLGAFVFLIYMKLNDIRHSVSNSQIVDFALQARVNSIFFELIIYALIALLIFSIVTFFYSTIITHRVAGPSLAIQAYIAELRRGNYDYQRRLRDYDELHPIMDALKELAGELKRKDLESSKKNLK